jgi:hypothetical protein
MVSGLPPDFFDGIRNSLAATPPPGIIPNYDNPPNDNRLAIIVITVSIALTTVAGLVRFYSRVFCSRRVRIEDCSFLSPNLNFRGNKLIIL